MFLPVRRSWLTVALLWCVCFLNYADRQAIFVLFPLLRESMKLSDVQLGIVGSAFMWMYAAFGPVAGWLGDRMSRRWLITAGASVWTLLAFATAFSHTYPQLVALRALSGLGEAFYFPAAMALISSYHGPATRSRAMALHQSAVYLGSIGGGSVAALLGQHQGWRSTFLWFSSAGALVVLLLLLFLREPELPPAEFARSTALPEHPPGFLASVYLFLSNRVALGLVAVFMGANFVAMAFTSWLPTYLHDRFHLTVGSAGVNATLYMQVASIGGVLVGGLLADRFARWFKGGRMLVQACGLLAAVAFLFVSGAAPTLTVLLMAVVGWGFCKGMYDSNIFASLYDVVPAANRSSAAGLLNSMGWLGGGFAPLLLGMAAQRWGMGRCLSATSGIYLLLGGLLMLTARRLSRGKAPAVFAKAG